MSKILLLEHEEMIAVPVSVKPEAAEFDNDRLASNVLFIHETVSELTDVFSTTS